jgi:hypothetical protein
VRAELIDAENPPMTCMIPRLTSLSPSVAAPSHDVLELSDTFAQAFIQLIVHCYFAYRVKVCACTAFSSYESY